MALPEHVKKLALDAVAGKESTDWIRKHTADDAARPVARPPADAGYARAGRRALEAARQNETLRHIRLVSVNRIDAPLPTPRGHGGQASGSAFLESLWNGNAVAVTKEAWERDDGR